MTETVWLAVLAIVGGSVIGPGVQRLLSRRGDDAKARVDETTADATAAGEWQELYKQQQGEIKELRADVKDLRADVTRLEGSLSEAEARVKVQASLLRSVCRWALLLRDELLRLDGNVPPMPPDVEAAITSLEA